MDRIIMHIDLDAFYAAVEERENPELKGKSVIIGADPKNGLGRGVVATCNYSAREFGVRSAMPISTAWKLCPDGVYLRPNFPLYAEASHKTMEIIRKYADKFQQLSIDEAFIDVTDKVNGFEDAVKLGEKLKREIMDKEKISSSVGIGSNKLIAKLASDYKKPYGLTVVKPEDVVKFLNPMTVRKLIGVGPKTEAALKEMGIERVEQLSRVNVAKLTHVFGKFGYRLNEMSRGIDTSQVLEEGQVKSIGKEVTFEDDVKEAELIFKAIEYLVDEFHSEIISGGIQFKTVNLKVRYEGFETHTRAKTLDYTNRKDIIIKTANGLVKPFLNGKKKIRLIGVRVSGIKFMGKENLRHLVSRYIRQ